MRDSVAGDVTLKMPKYFEVIYDFWILVHETYCKILVGLCKDVFMNPQNIFLDQENRTKLVSAFFPCFLEFLYKKV